MVKKYRETLIDRVWWTKKTRMKSEQRLKKLSGRNSLLNIYYSAFLLIASLISYTKSNYFENSNIDIDFLILIFSILLTIFSIYTANNRYSERADQMRECYTSLSIIEGELNQLSDDNIEKINELNRKYQRIMNSIENHLEIDYLSLKKEKTSEEWMKYLYLNLKSKVFTLIIFLLPILLTLMILKYSLAEVNGPIQTKNVVAENNNNK